MQGTRRVSNSPLLQTKKELLYLEEGSGHIALRTTASQHEDITFSKPFCLTCAISLANEGTHPDIGACALLCTCTCKSIFGAYSSFYVQVSWNLTFSWNFVLSHHFETLYTDLLMMPAWYICLCFKAYKILTNFHTFPTCAITHAKWSTDAKCCMCSIFLIKKTALDAR